MSPPIPPILHHSVVYLGRTLPPPVVRVGVDDYPLWTSGAALNISRRVGPHFGGCSEPRATAVRGTGWGHGGGSAKAGSGGVVGGVPLEGCGY